MCMISKSKQKFWLDGWIKGIILGTPILAKLWLIDKLFPKHVGLPHLDLTFHLINFLGWMGQGGYSEPILQLALFYQSL